MSILLEEIYSYVIMFLNGMFFFKENRSIIIQLIFLNRKMWLTSFMCFCSGVVPIECSFKENTPIITPYFNANCSYNCQGKLVDGYHTPTTILKMKNNW